MGIVFSYPTAIGPTVTWIPSKPPNYPIGHQRDFHLQVRGETAGGTVLVQDAAGPPREVLELVFDHLPQSDRNQAAGFFDTVRKSAEVFDYTDPAGDNIRVRWSNEFNFKQAAFGRYSGTIELLKEQPT